MARILTACIVLSGILLTSNTFGAPGTDVVLDPTPWIDGETSISTNPTDPDNMVMVCFEGGASDHSISVYYTTTGGSTASDWQLVRIDDTVDQLSTVVQRGDPSVAFSPDGSSVFVCYLAKEPGACSTPFISHVVCARSDDGGATFDPQDATIAYSGPLADKCYLTAGPSDPSPVPYNLYVVYTVGCTSGSLYSARSIDGGVSFDTPVSIGGGGSFGVPSVAPDGTVYVVYMENYTQSFAPATIKVAKSLDYGGSFSSAAIGTTAVTGNVEIPAQIGRGVMAVPSIDVAPSGRVYVAYAVRDRAVVNDLCLNHLTDGDWDTDIVVQWADDGSTWTPQRLIHKKMDGTSQFHPWLSVGEDGSVAVVFLDTRGDPVNNVLAETWIAGSVDDGVTWYEKKLSDVQSDVSSCVGCGSLGYFEYIGLSLAEGVARAAWPQSPACGTGNYEIAFDSISMDEITTPAVLQVPGQYATPLLAFQDAKAGDTVEIAGTAPAGFVLPANVTLVSVGGSAVLDAAGASSPAILIPTRYVGSGLNSFTISNVTDVGLGDAFNQDPTLGSPVTVSIDGCTIELAGASAGIDLSDVDALAVSNTTITGIGTTGVRVDDVLLTMNDCTIDLSGSGGNTGLIIMNSRYQSAGLPAVLVAGTTITGDNGITASESYVHITECDLEVAAGDGISISTGSQSTTHAIVENNLVVSAGTSGTGIHLGGEKLPHGVTTGIITNNTVDGWDTGIHCEATADGPGSYNYAVDIERNMVTEFANYGVSRLGQTNQKNASGPLTCNNAYSSIPGSKPFSENRSGNTKLEPRYCDGYLGLFEQYSLRVDSPGAEGNSPCGELIGARPVECMFDLVEDTTIKSGTEVRIVESILVPQGITLTLEPGVVMAVDSNQGPTPNDIFVEGTLSAVGTQADPVQFRSSDAGNWGSVWARENGSLELEYVEIVDGDGGVTVLDNGVCTATNVTMNATAIAVYAGDFSSPFGNPTVDLNQCAIVCQQGDGVWADHWGTVDVTGCTIDASTGVRVSEDGNAGIHWTAVNASDEGATAAGALELHETDLYATNRGVHVTGGATQVHLNSTVATDPSNGIGVLTDTGPGSVTIATGAIIGPAATGVQAETGTLTMPGATVQNCSTGIWIKGDADATVGMPGTAPAVVVNGCSATGVIVESPGYCYMEQVFVDGTTIQDPADWTGIHLKPGSDANLIRCQVQGNASSSAPGGAVGIRVESEARLQGPRVFDISPDDLGTGIVIDADSTALVQVHEPPYDPGIWDHTEILNCHTGIYVAGYSRPIIRDSEITNHTMNCVLIGPAATPDLGRLQGGQGWGNNSIYGIANHNGYLAGGPIRLGEFGTVTAEKNWWGPNPKWTQVSSWVDYDPPLTQDPYPPASWHEDFELVLSETPSIRSVYPVPSSGRVHIPLVVENQELPVEVAIFDTSGRLVRKVLDDVLSPGEHWALWDGKLENGAAAARGVYFARVRIGPDQKMERLVLTR